MRWSASEAADHGGRQRDQTLNRKLPDYGSRRPSSLTLNWSIFSLESFDAWGPVVRLAEGEDPKLGNRPGHARYHDCRERAVVAPRSNEPRPRPDRSTPATSLRLGLLARTSPSRLPRWPGGPPGGRDPARPCGDGDHDLLSLDLDPTQLPPPSGTHGGGGQGLESCPAGFKGHWLVARSKPGSGPGRSR